MKNELNCEWIACVTNAFTGKFDKYDEPVFVNKKYYRCGNCKYRVVVKTPYCPKCEAKLNER